MSADDLREVLRSFLSSCAVPTVLSSAPLIPQPKQSTPARREDIEKASVILLDKVFLLWQRIATLSDSNRSRMNTLLPSASMLIFSKHNPHNFATDRYIAYLGRLGPAGTVELLNKAAYE